MKETYSNTDGESKAQKGQGISPRKTPVVNTGTKTPTRVFLTPEPSHLVPRSAAFLDFVFWLSHDMGLKASS